VGAGRDDLGDLREVQAHRLAIAGRQDQSGTLAIFGTDGAEDVGGGCALITGSAWACAALCPPAGDLVLLVIRASSWNQISILSPPPAFSRATTSRGAGKFFKSIDRTFGLRMMAWSSG
jgi:hypothetical protein